MTEQQRLARDRFAALSGANPENWRVVEQPEIGVWYDFFDVATGRYGQCRLGPGGVWKQAPLGDAPVILGYSPLRPRRGGGIAPFRAAP